MRFFVSSTFLRKSFFAFPAKSLLLLGFLTYASGLWKERLREYLDAKLAICRELSDLAKLADGFLPEGARPRARATRGDEADHGRPEPPSRGDKANHGRLEPPSTAKEPHSGGARPASEAIAGVLREWRPPIERLKAERDALLREWAEPFRQELIQANATLEDERHTHADVEINDADSSGEALGAPAPALARRLLLRPSRGDDEAPNGILRQTPALGYWEGQGVPQDHAEAIKWFREAAELGNPRAQHNIGVAYRDGHGVRKDLIEAYAWPTWLRQQFLKRRS